MRQKFSTAWIESRQVRKQRKYRENAPLHIKINFVKSMLSKELKKKYNKNAVQLKKGDTVLIMRGEFKKKRGKVSSVNLKKGKINIDGIQRKKIDGTKVNVPLDPSVLQITELNLEGRKRFATEDKVKIEDKKAEVKKEIKQNKKNR